MSNMIMIIINRREQIFFQEKKMYQPKRKKALPPFSSFILCLYSFIALLLASSDSLDDEWLAC